jgi:hypothetical protein
MFKQISVGLAATAAGAYALVIRPWHLHWGATEEEAHQPLPGDAWIPLPKMESTRAIAIRAQPADIWPWLVQMGTGRAGWYSYDWLENLLPRGAIGAGISNAEQIIPAFQQLEVGESIPLSPTTGFTVAEIDPAHVLALRVTMSPLTGMPLDPHEPELHAYFDGSWVFVLKELDEQTTLLIERLRADYQPHLWLAPIVYLLLEPVFFMMERKMLLGIKQRAEQRRIKEAAEGPSPHLETQVVFRAHSARDGLPGPADLPSNGPGTPVLSGHRGAHCTSTCQRANGGPSRFQEMGLGTVRRAPRIHPLHRLSEHAIVP